MPRTTFSQDGLDIGNQKRDLTYLYGLSDFWVFLFEGKDKIDLYLEATSQTLSDTYSKFLQLTSSISIADIAVATSQQIKSVIILAGDETNNPSHIYTLPQTILSSRLIANRPFLPTTYLEDKVHYVIAPDGNSIQFYKPLSELGFPSRILPDQSKEYSLWFVDTLVDEQFVYKFYGKLIGVDPKTSTENFKNFIYGLYYLFTNGPNLALIRKGLNLALGIPLARETEVVLDIRHYLDTNQYLVITDLNSYLVPFGLTPSVVVGDTVIPQQELAQWIEIKDYINDGKWWINLRIPESVMPYVPPGQIDRYAKDGSYADYIMQNFLRHHTFLVNVKTIDFKNLQSFEQLISIIRESKPSYTTPLYIWTVPTPDEIINVDDTGLLIRADQEFCEHLEMPYEKMVRLYAYWANVIGTDMDNSISYVGNEISNNDATMGSARADTLLPANQDSYFEVTITGTPVGGDTYVAIGVATYTESVSNKVGTTVNSWGYYTDAVGGGSFKYHGGTATSYGATFALNDVIGVYVQLSNGQTQITFYKNGVSQGIAYTNLAGTLYPMVSVYQHVGTKAYLNFGATAFAYAVPNKATTNYGVYTTGNILTRGCPVFTRFNVDNHVATMLGNDPDVNEYVLNEYVKTPGTATLLAGGNVGYHRLPLSANNLDTDVINMNLTGSAPHVLTRDTPGVVNYIKHYRENTYPEAGWVKTFLSGNQDIFRVSPGSRSIASGVNYFDNTGVSQREFLQTDPSMRIVFLYATTQADLLTKFNMVGSVVPPLSTWNFTLFKPYITDGVINEVQIDEDLNIDYFNLLYNSFGIFFFRNIKTDPAGYTLPNPTPYETTYRTDTANYLSRYMPPQGYNTYAPNISALKVGDYLLFIRVLDNIVGTYWVTSNQTVNAPPFWVATMSDPLTINQGTSVKLPFWKNI